MPGPKKAGLQPARKDWTLFLSAQHFKYRFNMLREQARRLSSSTIFPSVIGSSRSLPPSRRGTEQNQQRLGQPLEVIT